MQQYCVAVPSLNPNRSQHRYISSGNEVDIVVIGSGPGGYVAAIKAAQLGMNVGILLESQQSYLNKNELVSYIKQSHFLLKCIIT